jgi:hypothetical protein
LVGICTKIGSDVGIITQQGVIPLSRALPFDPSAQRSSAITARIQNAMAEPLHLDEYVWLAVDLTFRLSS